MIMAALSIFKAWICSGMGIAKFLNDIGVRNIFDTKITWSCRMLTSGWLAVSLHYCSRLNAVWSEKLELNDTQKILLCHDYDLMYENINVVNKYSDLY
jgi:TM2 domain-containing membrane protein YozV